MSAEIADMPKQGEVYHCEKCGMKLQVTEACQCETGCPELMCCGQSLIKV